MTDERASPPRIKKERKPSPRDSRPDEQVPEQISPPLANEGPELVRDTHT